MKLVSRPRVGGMLLDDGEQRQSATEVEVKPGTVEAIVGFSAVPAYYVYCDRFAIRVDFLVEGSRVAVTDEIVVTREEPLRRP